MRGFETRGGSTTTRLGVLVVRLVVSCLGYKAIMGMNDRSSGSRIWEKGSKRSIIGGIESSKYPGIQDNHEGGNQPKDGEGVVPECGNRIWGTYETVRRSGGKVEL